MIARYSRPAMSALWSDEARFQLWLEVETVALEAMVAAGLAPQASLDAVRAKGAFDTNRVLEIEETVKHDVIAFLTNVTEHVGPEARYLHFGMTSSDLLDTTLAIQLCRATDMICADIEKLLETIKFQAQKYKYTPCVGRSHGIHAEPTTFGLKLATWYAELERQLGRLRFAREDNAVGMVSGPVGTFAHLPPSIEEHVCKTFGLRPDPVSTQVIGRDRHANLFAAYAQLAGSLERIVVEIRHLQRTEVREAEEFFSVGQKGSSAMPHKRNPVLSENITGLARLVRSSAFSAFENVPLWHERDISHSSVERVIAPDTTILLDFMLARTNNLVKNLKVYPENMQANLDMTQGLVFSGTLLVALAAKGLTREESYALVQEHALATWNVFAERQAGASFEARVRGDKRITDRLSETELTDSFSMGRHVRSVDFIFDRVFAKGVTQ